MPGQPQPALEALIYAHARMNRLHMLCDSPLCTHVLTLGISETLEEAIAAGPSPVAGTSADGGWIPDLPESEVTRAIHAAAVVLGWRRELTTDGRKTRCPGHTTGLVCARCLCRDCNCVGGPGFDVVRR